jgi:hypothetical protein
LVCLSLVVTLSALVFSYVRIIQTVLLSRRKVYAANQVDLPKRKNIKNERQLIITVIIMVTSFMVLFLPAGLLPIIDPDLNLGADVHVIFTYVMWSQNIVETLVYSIFHSKIRNAVKMCLFCRHVT